MTTLEKGFYVLKQAVKNPKPDRRSKHLHSVVEWRPGLRVFVKPGSEGKRGSILFSDNTQVYFGGNNPEIDVGNVLVPHLEKAPFAVGQLFAAYDSQATAGDVLAMACEKGLLDRNAIDSLIKDVESLDEEQYEEFRKKYWLVRGT